MHGPGATGGGNRAADRVLTWPYDWMRPRRVQEA